jgi:hypothetical protein
MSRKLGRAEQEAEEGRAREHADEKPLQPGTNLWRVPESEVSGE